LRDPKGGSRDPWRDPSRGGRCSREITVEWSEVLPRITTGDSATVTDRNSKSSLRAGLDPALGVLLPASVGCDYAPARGAPTTTIPKIIAGRGWIDLKGHDSRVRASGAPSGWFGHAGQAVGPDTASARITHQPPDKPADLIPGSGACRARLPGGRRFALPRWPGGASIPWSLLSSPGHCCLHEDEPCWLTVS
jgi:hypothetical protein